MDSEAMLLKCVQQLILTYDPDHLPYYPDFNNTFTCLAERAAVLGVKYVLGMERFKGMKCRTFRRDGRIGGFICKTRSMLDMQAALKKNVFVSTESYDLKTVSCHKTFRQNPEKLESFTVRDYDVNRLITQGVTGRSTILDTLARESRLMVNLERDCATVIEFSNISMVTDTPLTTTVSRGEQIRVMNKLTHFCHDRHFYMNREMLAKKPIRFSNKDRPPTCPDPAEPKITVDLRNKCKQDVEKLFKYYPSKKKKNVKTQFNGYSFNNFITNDEDEQCEDEVEAVSEGGNVMFPSPKFWDADDELGILDFASLYPSIMRAYNISYENLVYEARYLDLPDVKYLYASINPYETVAIAMVPGVIPELLELLVKSRSAIRKVEYNDAYRKVVQDKMQGAMKVVCNATYGFTGAEQGGMLAVKDIMYVVTSLGRYLQKETGRFLADNYAIPAVYGDTDSLFVRVYLNRKATVENMVLEAGERYKMNGYKGIHTFTWDNICDHYLHRSNTAAEQKKFPNVNIRV